MLLIITPIIIKLYNKKTEKYPWDPNQMNQFQIRQDMGYTKTRTSLPYLQRNWTC